MNCKLLLLDEYNIITNTDGPDMGDEMEEIRNMYIIWDSNHFVN
jgi:hypothetical protein